MKIRHLICAMMLSLSTVPMMSGCSLLKSGQEKYDSMVDLDEKANEAWANIDVQLQRRYDLIPNLVSIVKGSAAHEEKTLTEVQEARSAATQIKLTEADFSDPAKMAAFQKAQEQLKGSLSRLMAVQENYPTLQANQQFHDLMVETEGCENRLAIARKDYNAAVKNYNEGLRHVSGKIINPITNMEFKPRLFWSADEAAKVAPKVDFSSPSSSK